MARIILEREMGGQEKHGTFRYGSGHWGGRTGTDWAVHLTHPQQPGFGNHALDNATILR